MKLSEIAEFLSLEYKGEDIEISALNSLLKANLQSLLIVMVRKIPKIYLTQELLLF